MSIRSIYLITYLSTYPVTHIAQSYMYDKSKPIILIASTMFTGSHDRRFIEFIS